MTTHPGEPLAYPMERTCPFDPAPGYSWLREQPTLTKLRLPTGRTAWAVVRPEDVRAFLGDRRFSADMRHPGFPILLDHMRPSADFNTSLVGMDGEEHSTTHRAVVGEFTARRMRLLKPRIQEIVDEHIDRMLAGPKPVDLVGAFTFPVSCLMICEILGVPFEDRDDFYEWSSRILTAGTPQESAAALSSLFGYMDKLVASKELDPTDDDLLGRQITNPDRPAALDHNGMTGLAFMLFMAGHDAPANSMGLAVTALLENPGQLDKLRDHPERWSVAVEEILRYLVSTEIATSRVALEDVELGGVTIRAGEGVMGLISGANRDPELFEDPDSFDVARTPNRHVSFGAGPHVCLGQHMSRIEIEIALETLFRRLPTLRLAVPFDDIEYKDDAVAFGVRRLMVTW